MNELNLCEILKGHEGETFYCSLVGEDVTFKGIGHYSCTGVTIIEVTMSNKVPIELYSKGGFSPNGECQLFPSKDQRDWNKWFEEQKPKVPKTWSELLKSGDNKTYDLGRNDLDDILVEFEEFDSRSYSNNVTPIEKSALALLKIHQLIEVGYGGNVTNEEWKSFDGDESVCYTIYYSFARKGFNVCAEYFPKKLIAFHTKEQAEEFLKYPENIQLLKDYFMV